MLELLALIILIAALFLIIPLVGFFFKVVFKIAVIPLTILGFILKAVLLVVGGILCLVLGIPVFLILLVALPLLFVGVILWAGAKTVLVFA